MAYEFRWVSGTYAHETSFAIFIGTENKVSASGYDYAGGAVILSVAQSCDGPNYQGGVCADCGASCIHLYVGEDGTCADCGHACAGHVWVNGVCSVCSVHCKHSWVEGECVTCGMVCGHNWNDGVCDVCGIRCQHTYQNNICTNCGFRKPATEYHLSGVINGQDYLFIPTEGHQLLVCNLEDMVKVREVTIPFNTCRGIGTDKDGMIWIVGDTSLVHRYDPYTNTGFTTRNYKTSGGVASTSGFTVTCYEGLIYFGAGWTSNIGKYDPQTDKFSTVGGKLHDDTSYACAVTIKDDYLYAGISGDKNADGIDTAEIIAQLGKNPLVRGVTLSGGEPLLQAEFGTAFFKEDTFFSKKALRMAVALAIVPSMFSSL